MKNIEKQINDVVICINYERLLFQESKSIEQLTNEVTDMEL